MSRLGVFSGLAASRPRGKARRQSARRMGRPPLRSAIGGGRNVGTRSSAGGHDFVSRPSRRYPQSGAFSRLWPCGSVSGKTRCARGAWICCKLDRSASRLSRRAVAKARAEKWLLEPRQGAKVTRKRSVTARFGTFIRFTCPKALCTQSQEHTGIARGEAVALGKLLGEWHCGRAAIVARPQAVKIVRC